MDYLYLGCDKRVTMTGLSNQATGAALNDWTGTWDLFTAVLAGGVYVPGVALGGSATGSLAYVAASSGDYAGLIPDTVTAGLTNLGRYFVRGTFVSADLSQTETRWLECQARRRGRG